MWFAAAALVVGLGLAHGGEKAVKGPKPVPPPSVLTEPEGQACGSYGTKIEFLDSPAEAAKQAKKENKLVFVLHVSGNFEDPRFT
jgi:hypothetical protein